MDGESVTQLSGEDQPVIINAAVVAPIEQLAAAPVNSAARGKGRGKPVGYLGVPKRHRKVHRDSIQ